MLHRAAGASARLLTPNHIPRTGLVSRFPHVQRPPVSSRRLLVLATLCLALAMQAAAATNPGPPPTERDFVANLGSVRVGVDPKFPPFSFRDEQGRATGLDLELFAMVAQRIGITYKIVPTASWTDTYQRAQRGEIDVLLSVAHTPAREREFLFTRPYVRFPVAIITRTDAPFSSGLVGLQGRAVAAPRDYVTTEAIARDFPQVRLLLTDNVEDAMRRVSRGEADALVSNLANATWVHRRQRLSNLKIGGITGYQFDLCVAVRRDWPLLAAAFDRELGAITEPERQRVFSRWIQMDFDTGPAWADEARHGAWTLLAISAAGILLMLLFVRNNRRLATVNAEKSNLMRMTAHDLKNPLTGLMLNLELLRSDLRPTGESVREICSRLIPLVERMNHIVHNLLTLQALESGRREFKMEPVSVSSLIQEVVQAQGETAARKVVRLEYQQPADALIIRGDRQAVHEIIENLLSNALKFAPFGSQITVSAERVGRRARLRVTDQGPGIPKEKLHLLFTKFAKLGTKTTGGESSTGLGLSIVKSLVEHHGGRVWCDLPEPGGASFAVEFPLES